MNIAQDVKNFMIKQPMVLLAIIGFVLGILIATEYSSRIPRIINPAISSVALDNMETKLENEQSSVKESLEAVDTEIEELQSSLKTRQGGLTNLVNEVEAVKEQVGFTNVSGEGIEIIIDDSNSGNQAANAIAHASDLRDLTDFLWSRGAQAISIGADGNIEERIVFSSSIDCVVNTVLINSTKASPPFKLKVIGNRDALMAAINERDSLKSIYDRVDKEGLIFKTTDVTNITVGKYSGNILSNHAKVQ